MLVLTARLAVDPDRVDEFESLACRLWEATLRSEPGCRRYDYVRLPERGAYVTFMTFDDHDAFLVHQASDHHTAIAAGPIRELVRSIELEFGQSVDGAFGPIHDADPGQVEVDEQLRRQYARRYPAPDFGGWES